jgi:hypothetical protein
MEFLNQGAVITTLLAAGGLALVLGFVILALYQRAVRRGMESLSDAGPHGNEDQSVRGPPASPLAYTIVDLERDKGGWFSLASLSFDPSLRCAAIYVVAGTSFAIVGATLLFAFSNIEFLPLRAACVFWATGWPVVLTLNLMWTSDRRRQLVVTGAYALMIVLFCLWGARDSVSTRVGSADLPGFLNPLLLWGIYAAPSVYLLLFQNRTVRAVGPILLIFAALTLAGWPVAMILLASPIGMLGVKALFATTDLSATSVLILVTSAGLIVGGWVGWIVVNRFADAYAARRFSDQIVIIDSIWFLQSLMLCSSLARERGIWGAAGLLAFVVYKLVTVLGFRLYRARLEERPLRLLLLRVFGFGRRSSRLFDLIAARWRYLGAIRLIAAPDLASRTIEPGKLFAFVRGRLRQLFVGNEAALAARIAEVEEKRDPDGRFRIVEIFCAGEIWRSAVRSLMADTHLVVMDLRNFGPQHHGCAFELQSLLDAVALERLILLINKDTDVGFLKGILDERWRKLLIGSPNANTANPTCVLLQMDRRDAAVLSYLMKAGARVRLPEAPGDQTLWTDPAQPELVG